MINNVSRKIAEVLCDYVERTKEVDYVRYGIEIFIRGFIKLITIVLVAYAFGVFLPMMVVVVTFSFFRFLTGGHHYSTYIRCLFVGLFVMLSLAFISTKLANFVNSATVNLALLCSVLFGFYLSQKFAPSNHFYKKLTDHHKFILKRLSLLAIMIWGILVYLLNLNSVSIDLILASIFGFLLQIISIHPYSYVFVNKIENLLERRDFFEKNS